MGMIKKIGLILLLGFTLRAGAQDKGLETKLLETSFSDLRPAAKKLRKITMFKKQISYFNPLSYAGAALLFVYQNLISEQIQADCMYQVSCSEYTKRSIENKGLVIGTLMGFNQLSECFSGAQYEHRTSSIHQHKIDNRVEH